MNKLREIMFALQTFLAQHPTVKSAWRAAVIVTLSALAHHFGFYDIISEIAAQAGV